MNQSNDQTTENITSQLNQSLNEFTFPEGWDQKLDANGWVKFPNGLLLQWGCYDRNETGSVTVPFNKPFTEPAFTAFVTYLDAAGEAEVGVTTLGTTNMILDVDNHKSGLLSLRWLALGVLGAPQKQHI